MLSHYPPFLLMFLKCVICWQDLAEMEEALGTKFENSVFEFYQYSL